MEKHLKIHDNGTASIANTGSTTQASIISKSLYERVLRNNVKNSRTTTPSPPTPPKKDKQVTYNTINRNNRGPQTDGLQSTEEAKNTETSTRGRFQYVNIARRRSTTTSKPNESDEPTELNLDEEPVTERVDSATTQRQFRRMSTPEYVTIRRTRPSTSTTTETNPSTRYVEKERYLSAKTP